MGRPELPPLGLEGSQVSLIYIDYAFGFVLEPPELGEPTARIRIGMTFELLGADGTSHPVIPGPPQDSVAPALRLHNQVVLDATASADGTLKISFEDGSGLTVAPDPNYEAWELNGPVGMMVCLPGGGVAFWPAGAEGTPA